MNAQCNDDAMFCVHTYSTRQATCSWEDTIAAAIESLHTRPLWIRLRNGQWRTVTVPTVPNELGWSEVERRGSHIRLDPIGWVHLFDIVAVRPRTPAQRSGSTS